MFSFESAVIDATVEKLLRGQDYRQEVVNDINVKFLDFTLRFFRKIVDAKLNNDAIGLDWYQRHFLNAPYAKEDIAVHSSMNLKTITNIYGGSSKQVVIDVARHNYEYLKMLIRQLESDNDLDIQIKLTRNGVSVDLNLSESLLVLNALATKKIALRGGAWSAIGKRVEKPLLIKLCALCGVDAEYYSAESFVKDNNKDVDREVDFKLYSRSGQEYRCEVKLIGKGNPESADAVIARDSDIFIADTLSDQSKHQLDQRGIMCLELRGHNTEYTILQFKNILSKLNVPFV